MTMINRSGCKNIINMNLPSLGVTGMPSMRCGIPDDYPGCPFDNEMNRDLVCPKRVLPLATPAEGE